MVLGFFAVGESPAPDKRGEKKKGKKGGEGREKEKKKKKRSCIFCGNAVEEYALVSILRLSVCRGREAEKREERREGRRGFFSIAALRAGKGGNALRRPRERKKGGGGKTREDRFRGDRLAAGLQLCEHLGRLLKEDRRGGRTKGGKREKKNYQMSYLIALVAHFSFVGPRSGIGCRGREAGWRGGGKRKKGTVEHIFRQASLVASAYLAVYWRRKEDMRLRREEKKGGGGKKRKKASFTFVYNTDSGM